MKARLLLEVAIRLLGLWMSFESFVEGVAFLSYMPGLLGGQVPGAEYYLVTVAVSVVAKVVVGVIALIKAPRIASWIYPDESGDSEIALGVRPGDLYHIACFILGTYFLVHGVSLAAQSSFELVNGFASDRFVSRLLTFLVYFGSGLLLVFGGRRIAEWMAAIKYDPDSVPKQQFSIRLLLIVTFVVALILSIVRIATMR
jgi:hypothetical protein